MAKILIPIQGDYVAPRFDLATEVLVARHEGGRCLGEPKTIIMEKPSDEALCQMIVEEDATDVVCGGIEDLHYDFLVWKKVRVIDSVLAEWKTALEKALAGSLRQGDILLGKQERQVET